jgi:hypothetical protein
MSVSRRNPFYLYRLPEFVIYTMHQLCCHVVNSDFCVLTLKYLQRLINEVSVGIVVKIKNLSLI